LNNDARTLHRLQQRHLRITVLRQLSGHGFKNGPAMGEYVASVVARGAPLEKLFTLGYKPKPGHLVE